MVDAGIVRVCKNLGSMARIPLIFVLLFTTSCASVEIRKIGSDGEVTGPEGMRFYMPRPYVAVNEPFIVGGEAYLVGGEITPDGQYVLINDVQPTEDANNRFISRFLGSTTRKIGVTSVIAVGGATPGAGTGGGTEQSTSEEANGAADESEGADGNSARVEDGDGETENTTSSDDSVEEKSGTLGLKVANDNSAFAVTPLKRYFDIVWLPDFDEQYVVQGKAGLGNASIAMQMGQGWSLQGIEASVDNGAITGLMLGLIGQGADILSTLGRAQLGLPPVAMGETTEEGEQAGSEGSDATSFSSGTPLTVKVTFVRIAAPGLYPILKPEEMAKIPSSQSAFEDRMLVPVAPMTNIAFNTYEAVIVEAALATGDSALRLHQYIDLRPGDRSVAPVSGKPEDSEQLKDPDWNAVETTIQSLVGGQYTIDRVSGEVDTEKVTIWLKQANGNPITNADDQAAAKAVMVERDAGIRQALAANAPGYQAREIDYEFPGP